MAATYSSFMTTEYYSPVFNTALFDGPFRIYFSQSYESSALKIYHLLQTEYQDLWSELKKWASSSREHVFLLMYPDDKDLQMVFHATDTDNNDAADSCVQLRAWAEGIILGISQPASDLSLSNQVEKIGSLLKIWVQEQKSHEATL
ncbi:MAG: hypothetical protein H7061_13920 [Bdellovibrionaceae bacterium]|nr:hypothetical protein [Bdellovibrio sp.]